LISIILISSTRPPDKSAAAITLARHLNDHTKYCVTCLESEAVDYVKLGFLSKILKRLSKTRFYRFVDDFWFLLNFLLPIHLLLAVPKTDESKKLVLTVACGHGWMTAMKYARRHGIPLAVRFDDWWPDVVRLHWLFKKILERQFHKLADRATLRLCISEGMKMELKLIGDSAVVLPIPEDNRQRLAAGLNSTPFRICYLGNMYDYGKMLGELAEKSLSEPDLRMEFRGNEPNWPKNLKSRLVSNGQLHGYLDGPEFMNWYASFDCYLVAMFFEKGQRRRVRTCFATKLLDYSSLGRPILIWGPEESSVVVWAKKTGAALCVTSPNPADVLAALKKLAIDPENCRALGDRARAAYETDFSPMFLRKTFDEALSSIF
jgi:glycosyltransferase involved in cell wall biosynthesis